jgi:hypothetical protein
MSWRGSEPDVKRTPVIHPFLFSLFPILALYAYNIKSIPVPPGELAGPLGGSLAGAAVLFFVLRAALKDAAKTGLIVSLLFLWFFSFGHIADQISLWTGGIFNRSLFFATAIILGLSVFLVIRSRRSFNGLTGFLNVVAATLIVFNLVSVGQTLARRPHLVLAHDVRVSGPSASRPNIYYIILDAYTRADILKEVFSFDNGDFLAGLESRGFFIASESYANYSQTYQSLASSLNFTYLDELARDIGTGSSDREPLYRMIQENGVGAFLKRQGYRLISIASSIEPTDLKKADLYIGFAGSTSEFLRILLNTTPLPLFVDLSGGASPYDAHRRRILNAFRFLAESPLEQGPFFLFAHLMCPHPPFVFGPDGEPLEPDYLFSMVDADRLHGSDDSAIAEYIVRYREQVAFLNKKILEAVDFILSRSPQPPIIILQGDHGSRAYTDFDHPDASYFKESLAILNAYHLPGDDQASVYPRISPVNTFRLVFKQYFGAELDLLEDRSVWSTWRRPYRFIPFDETSYKATVESVKTEMKPKAPIVQKR